MIGFEAMLAEARRILDIGRDKYSEQEERVDVLRKRRMKLWRKTIMIMRSSQI
jgi:hypothetical protein